MNNITATLESVGDELLGVVDELFVGSRTLSEPEVMEVMAAAARIVRAGEALLVEAAGQVCDRSDGRLRADRMTARFGCRSASELVQRVTRVSKQRAADLVKAGRAVMQAVALTSGEVLPAALPGMRGALATGEVAEPREARAMRKRGFTLGVCRDGLHPVRGHVLPEVAAQLQRAFDSILNPKVDGAVAPAGPHFVDATGSSVDPSDPDAPSPAMADNRSRAQKQHDALATVLTVIAASGSLPQLGGAAPTLVVSVRAEDLASGRGFAHLSGTDEPISLAAARHVACSGAVQRVESDHTGRIVSLGTPERVFGHHLRRAITLRDGGCLIPGCHVPAEWCEIHHVTEYSRGGPTHTDNGVLLCWHHHRTLDSSGWMIRMNRGVPEVRGSYWWDAKLKWRPVTTSPVRMRERVTRRT
jgi:hypothetical protein